MSIWGNIVESWAENISILRHFCANVVELHWTLWAVWGEASVLGPAWVTLAKPGPKPNSFLALVNKLGIMMIGTGAETKHVLILICYTAVLKISWHPWSQKLSFLNHIELFWFRRPWLELQLALRKGKLEKYKNNSCQLHRVHTSHTTHLWLVHSSSVFIVNKMASRC